MNVQGEKLNGGGIMRWRSGDYLDNQLVVHWGKVPLLPDGLLGPDVPGFQQGSLLELVVSVNHLGTLQLVAWSWAATCPTMANWVRFPLVKALLCSFSL